MSDCFYSVPGDPPFDFCRKFVCLVPFVFCFVIEVACSTDGIKGYIEDLRQKVIDDKKIAKLKIRSTTAATIASVVGVISFFINITSGNNKIKYIFCFIGAFILGVLLSDPAKNLVKRLLKEE